MQLNQKMDALLSLSGGMGMMHLQQHQGWMHGAGGYNNQGEIDCVLSSFAVSRVGFN